MMLIQRDVWRSGRGFEKNVISGGQLSVKLSTPMCPLDQHHVVQIRSLHGCTEELVCTRYVPMKNQVVTSGGRYNDKVGSGVD